MEGCWRRYEVGALIWHELLAVVSFEGRLPLGCADVYKDTSHPYQSF